MCEHRTQHPQHVTTKKSDEWKEAPIPEKVCQSLEPCFWQRKKQNHWILRIRKKDGEIRLQRVSKFIDNMDLTSTLRVWDHYMNQIVTTRDGWFFRYMTFGIYHWCVWVINNLLALFNNHRFVTSFRFVAHAHQGPYAGKQRTVQQTTWSLLTVKRSNNESRRRLCGRFMPNGNEQKSNTMCARYAKRPAKVTKLIHVLYQFINFSFTYCF